MNTLERLTSLLGDYEHLFQNVNDYETGANMCGDVAINLIDEFDYYGCDFSGSQQVYMLFFRGSSNYFPGIWIGNNNISDIDKCPIHIFDLQNDEEDNLPYGNVKQYVIQILNKIIESRETSRKDKNDAKKLISKLSIFSDDVIDKGKYVLKVNN